MITYTKDRTILHDIFDRAAKSPDAPVYHIGGGTITFAGLKEGVLRAAGALAARGVRRGGHLAFMMPTSAELLFDFYGAQLLGAVPCILNPSLPAPAQLRRMRQMDIAHVIGRADYLESIRAAAAEKGLGTPDLVEEAALDKTAPPPADWRLPEPREVSHFQLTSGSSGEPRAAVITHYGVYNVVEVFTDIIKLDPSRDVLVGWLPLYHDLGLTRFYFQPVQSGCPCHLFEASIRNFRPWLETISREKGTFTAGPDFTYRMAARMIKPEGLDLSHWRIGINGSEPVRMSTIELFERTFNVPGVIRPSYGLAEMTLSICAMLPGEPLRADAEGHVACGRPYYNVRVRIVDEEGRDLPPETPGEIALDGEAKLLGYYNDPESTAKVLRDGWLFTGDMGKLDRDGYLYILGRKRAMIKRAGALIAPREIEEVVDRIPGVRLCAAVGVAREELGGTEDVAVVAEVKPDELAAPDDRAALRAQIATAVKETTGAQPARVALVEPRTIPRTGSGKIKYMELRERLASGGLEPSVLK